MATTNYFYFDENGNRNGPVNEQQLKELATQGTINPSTPMETDTGHKGTAGQVPGLNFNAPSAAPSPIAASMPIAVPTGPTNPLSKTLNTYFMVHWICMAAMIPTCGLSWIAGMVFMFILLYMMWKQVPTHIARTTPGKALGFSFIPFFQLYWILMAFKGLGEDMNKTLQQRGIQYRVNEGLGTASAILHICNLCLFYYGAFSMVGLFIPFVGFLIAILAIPLMTLHGMVFIACVVVTIFFIKSVKDGAVLMLEQDS